MIILKYRTSFKTLTDTKGITLFSRKLTAFFFANSALSRLFFSLNLPMVSLFFFIVHCELS